jgi:excisionase family DNA binding protein
VVSRLPLGASVRGPSAWIVWQAARDSLRSRLRQLEVDPHVHGGVVRHFRGTLNDLEQAALEFREWERSRSATDSAELESAGLNAGLEGPSFRWVDTGLVARQLGCSRRWVTTLCRTGQLAGTRFGREWRIDPSSVEEFHLRGVVNAA